MVSQFIVASFAQKTPRITQKLPKLPIVPNPIIVPIKPIKLPIKSMPKPIKLPKPDPPDPSPDFDVYVSSVHFENGALAVRYWLSLFKWKVRCRECYGFCLRN